MFVQRLPPWGPTKLRRSAPAQLRGIAPYGGISADSHRCKQCAIKRAMTQSITIRPHLGQSWYGGYQRSMVMLNNLARSRHHKVSEIRPAQGMTGAGATTKKETSDYDQLNKTPTTPPHEALSMTIDNVVFESPMGCRLQNATTTMHGGGGAVQHGVGTPSGMPSQPSESIAPPAYLLASRALLRNAPNAATRPEASPRRLHTHTHTHALCILAIARKPETARTRNTQSQALRHKRTRAYTISVHRRTYAVLQ